MIRALEGWRFQRIALALLILLASLSACDGGQHSADGGRLAIPAQVALGKHLYLDSRLSRDGQVSCSSCHQPDRAFTDGRAASIGIGGQKGTRNAPSLLDASVMTQFFWDGRERTLETVVLQPFTNPVEMGLGSTQALVQRLKIDAGYAEAFALAFPAEPSITGPHISTALVAFIRSVSHGRSPYDRYRAGANTVLSSEQQAGLTLFTGKAGCSECHRLNGNPSAFTDNQFHHLGVGESAFADGIAKFTVRSGPTANLGNIVLSDVDIAGLGRFVATRKAADLAAFRTPSLRNVAVTAPYMHNGSVATLDEAVDQEVYYRSLSKGRPLALTVDERRQLISFLKALTNQDVQIH